MMFWVLLLIGLWLYLRLVLAIGRFLALSSEELPRASNVVHGTWGRR